MGQGQYTFEGYDLATGKGIYQGNFPKGTPKTEKGERILNYIQNVWSHKLIDLVVENADGTTSIIQAQFDPDYDEKGNRQTDASKMMGGNRHGNAHERRVTLDLADDYYQIASEAKYNYSKKEEGKTSDTHEDVEAWHYFVNEILYKENGETKIAPYAVTINVKERGDGSFVYSFNAEEQQKFDAEQQKRQRTRRTLHADVNQTGITGKANALPSANSIRNKDRGVNKEISDITPKLDDSQNSMGRSFNELVQSQRGEIPNIMPKLDPAAKTQQAAQNAAEMQREVPDIMPKLADIGSQADATAGDPEFEAYMDSLAQDENDLTDPVTTADHLYDAKLRRLQQEEAQPESNSNIQIFFLIVLMAPFSNRETCACEMPTSAETSIWVLPS